MDSDETGKPFEVRDVESEQVCNTMDFEHSRKMGIVDLHSAHNVRKE